MILNESFMKKILVEEFEKRLDFILNELTTSYSWKGNKRSAVSNPSGLKVRHKKTGDEFEIIGFEGEGEDKKVKLLSPGSPNKSRMKKKRSKHKDYLGNLNSGSKKEKNSLMEKEEVENRESLAGDYILVSLKELESEYEL